MFKHYLKIGIRNIIRNKLYTIINIIGLSTGMAASLMLMVYVENELSFDQFHENKNQIYRIVSTGTHTGNISAKSPYKLAPLIHENFPQVKQICRIAKHNYLVKKGEDFIRERNCIQADSSFFSIFSFNLIHGNKQTALKENSSIVISKSMAKKYFPDEKALGKTLEFQHREKSYFMKITGIMEDIPADSQIQADFILPMYTMIWGYENINRKRVVPSFEGWMSTYFMTYVFLPSDIKLNELSESINAQIDSQVTEKFPFEYSFQPFLDVHLFSDHLNNNLENKGNLKLIYLFSLIAALILVIAIINYIILSTAKSLKRNKEIGLRKVVGANRAKIMKQILGESIILSLLSLPVAILLAHYFLPQINILLGESLSFNLIEKPILGLGILGISIITGIISGSYIAFYLSGFKPIDVFRDNIALGVKGALFQKSLIIVQLFIFIGLIICAGGIYQQVQFMKRNNVLGFEKENLISVPANGEKISEQYLALKNELLSNPNIKYVSSSFTDAPAFSSSISATAKVTDSKTGKEFWYSYSGELPENAKNMIIFNSNSVDFDFAEALGLTIVAGRSFNKENRTDRKAVMVNEEFVKHFEIKNPLTEKFKLTDESLNIIGIVKDYHSESLTQKILPLKLIMSNRYGTRYMRQIIIKLNGKNTAETLAYIEQKWKDFFPNTPFEYTFNNVYIDNMYKAELNLAKLIGSFSILAIFIASLGLFGLSLFLAQKKLKEIVIRKTMGASIWDITGRLVRQYFSITIVANILAMPVAWYFMDQWLQNFEYQNMIDHWIFVIAGVSSIMLCVLTVSYNTIKVAVTNPVQALKYE